MSPSASFWATNEINGSQIWDRCKKHLYSSKYETHTSSISCVTQVFVLNLYTIVHFWTISICKWALQPHFDRPMRLEDVKFEIGAKKYVYVPSIRHKAVVRHVLLQFFVTILYKIVNFRRMSICKWAPQPHFKQRMRLMDVKY